MGKKLKVTCSEDDSLFRKAVEGTPDISKGFCKGLKAIKRCDAKRISANNSRLIDGSVDIDACTIKLYPDEPRWDYAVGYNKKVFFIEIHPAQTSEIKIMLRKVCWLTEWLKNNATKINELPAGQPRFQWVHTDTGEDIRIPHTSKQYKQLKMFNLYPTQKTVVLK